MDFLNIFIAPAKVGQNVLKKKTFPWILLVAIIFLSLITFALSMQQTREMVIQQLKRQYEMMGQQLTASALESMIGITMISALVGVVLSPIVLWFLFSLVLFLLGGFRDSEGSFKQTLTLVGYCNLISALGGIITAGLMMAGIQNVDFSPALFISAEAAPGLLVTSLLQSFNLFRIWKYVALGIAYGSFMEKKSSAVTLTVVLFVLSTAAMTVPVLFMPK
ncbi:YIP1 family protein [Oscillospiraceae bacterium MB08-C2-2]|nr:YIP1 family protein [Oscillospiraceae bacterium MB08-C2-2]